VRRSSKELYTLSKHIQARYHRRRRFSGDRYKGKLYGKAIAVKILAFKQVYSFVNKCTILRRLCRRNLFTVECSIFILFPWCIVIWNQVMLWFIWVTGHVLEILVIEIGEQKKKNNNSIFCSWYLPIHGTRTYYPSSRNGTSNRVYPKLD